MPQRHLCRCFSLCFWLCLAALLLPISVGPVRADDSKLEVTHDFAYRGLQVWRGISLREFPVLNASTTVAHQGGFAVNFWAGLDLSDERDGFGEIHEIDIDLYYRHQGSLLDFRAGYVELVFPGSEISRTGELYTRLHAALPLKPSLEVYYNVDLLEDLFALAGIGHTFRLTDSWQLNTRGALAWSGAEYARFFGGQRSGLHHWAVDLELSRDWRRQRVTYRLSYTESLDQRVLPRQPVNLWGGVYFSLRY